jgi:hypothetical protein
MMTPLIDSPFGKAVLPPKQFRGYTKFSEYIPMRDGTPLAATLFLPQRSASEQRLPTLLYLTRYWRDVKLVAPFNRLIPTERLNPRTGGKISFFTSHGYALVYVDERGTGASFGSWPYPFSDQMRTDMWDLVEWAIAQPWSSGRVGAMGTSYVGMTSEIFASIGHPAVRAVVPRFNHPDPFTDIAYPGGIFNQRFIRAWGEFGKQLDLNHLPPEFGPLGRFVSGVQPVQGPDGAQRLEAALRDHQENGSMVHHRLLVTYRDEVQGSMQVSMDAMGLQRDHPMPFDSDVPIFGWGSWMDAGTADVALRRLRAHSETVRTAIGAWNHGGTKHASPYLPADQLPDPGERAQWAEILLFLDAYLKDAPNGVTGSDGVFYYTLGAETWQRANSFPPPGTRPERWYLNADSRLMPTAPPPASASGDEFQLDFAATTGLKNRWWELSVVHNSTVEYPGRQAAARHMLTYFTPPLEEDIEIAGYAVVNLFLTASHPDFALFVYLEDVFPSGEVVYLTEGQLRSLHRRIAGEKSSGSLALPYHSFRREDALPVVPGETARLAFALLPVSALVRRGHRLRLGIAGHDADTFLRIPVAGTPVIQVHHSEEHASYIELPLAPRG